MDGVVKVIDMLGATIIALQDQIAQLQAENAALKAALPPHVP